MPIPPLFSAARKRTKSPPNKAERTPQTGSPKSYFPRHSKPCCANKRRPGSHTNVQRFFRGCSKLFCRTPERSSSFQKHAFTDAYSRSTDRNVVVGSRYAAPVAERFAAQRLQLMSKTFEGIIGRRKNGAGEGIRTLDHHVGNAMLYH